MKNLRKIVIAVALVCIANTLFGQSSYYTTWITTLNSWGNTPQSFSNVYNLDYQITLAAADGLISDAEFVELDALIRKHYRINSGGTLHYGDFPNVEGHLHVNSNQVRCLSSGNGVVGFPQCGTIQIDEGKILVLIVDAENKSCRIHRQNAANPGISGATATFNGVMFNVEGTLVIKGQPNYPIIIDGGATISGTYTNGGEVRSNVTASYPSQNQMVKIPGGSGGIRATFATFQNQYATTSSAMAIHFVGSGVGACVFYGCNFYNNRNDYSSANVVLGSAIYSSASYANITLPDHTTFNGLLMNRCHFRGNLVDSRPDALGRHYSGGGAISIQGGTLKFHLLNSIVESSYCPWHGGAIFWNRSASDCNMKLDGTSFINNYGGIGGAVYSEGNLTVDNCTFDGNHAFCIGNNAGDIVYSEGNGYNGCGGGLLVRTSNAGDSNPTSVFVANNCEFKNNVADLNGGGLLIFVDKTGTNYSINVDATIQGGTKIHDNTAGCNGGGLAIATAYACLNKSYTAELKLNNGQIYNNTALGNKSLPGSNPTPWNAENGWGGGVYVEKCKINIAIGSTFQITNNSAKKGGAIAAKNLDSYNNLNHISIAAGELKNNTASIDGGGIYINDNYSDLEVSGTVSIIGNDASTSGGGVYAGGTIKMGAGNLTVMDNYCLNRTVKDNIYLPTGKTLVVNSDSFRPLYVGVFAESTAVPFPIISKVSSVSPTTLRDLYLGMENGDYNVFDDKQIYAADYNQSADANNIYFINTPWSPYQRTVTTEGHDWNNINNAKELTAFLWKVNGIQAFAGAGDATLHGKLTSDIDMTGQHWVPIGSSSVPFTGKLDGDGYTISGIDMASTNASTEYGLFGYVGAGADIKNITLRDGFFSGSDSYAGSLASQMQGGTLNNCQSQCKVLTTNTNCIIGGLVGYANGGEIHSCYSCAELMGYTMGGLVGETASGHNLKNNFANAKFQYKGTDNSKYIGGLVGVNAGTTANCYVRENSGNSLGSASYGTLVGNNNGTVAHCFAPTTPFVAAGNASEATTGTYSVVADGDSYQYRVHDCRTSTTNKPLQRELNAWVETQTGSTTYAKWDRPTTKLINGDYPLLRLGLANAVTGATILDYGDINDLMANYTAAGQAIFMYGGKDGMDSNSGSSADLYVGEDAAFTQSAKAGSISGTAEIFLDNSAGANGANPTSGGTDEIDWHFFSTPLSNAPLGINYTDATQYAYDATIPHYQHTGNGYFPTGVNDYYDEWDFYAYDEPNFHWINFKRNSNSHWAEIEPTTQIIYTNESTLVPGKGYMVALADETLLQCEGTFTDGNVNVELSCEGFYRTGLNLLGNPYQSYLDFEAFATTNSTIWSSETTPYYIVMDEDQRDYVAYAVGQSPNTMLAGRYLHPHQGFMVVTDKTGNTASFTNAMRVTDVDGYDAHFRGQQVAYPLVNLIATDANGNRDIATAELGRPDKGGAIVADFASLAKCLVYVHYEDKDYRIAFTQAGISTLPVRFEAFEAGSYTLTWSLENGEFSYMHLIDNIAGQDIDMLTTQEYSFTASTDDLKSRFKLVFEYTGIGEDEAEEANAIFAYLSNGQLVVEGEGNLQIIDLNGRMLQESQLSGTLNTVSLPEMARGLYILKLNDKTQKIVM